jgi:precorrin-2 dehydrogenase/sirohydrochlorin ferrochelatase
MPEYPIVLQLAGKCCVVVGSGLVGLRKVRGLLSAGARVRLISPTLLQQAGLEGVERIPRAFQTGDLDGAALVFAATGDNDSDRAVGTEARRLGIPVCLAGLPEEGDFSLPAVLHRGDLTVSVTTAGRSPALATLVRDQLESLLPDTWAIVLDIAAAVRQRALSDPDSVDYSTEKLRHLLSGSLLELLAGCDVVAVDRWLQHVFGPSWSLASLGISLPERNP